MKTIPFCALAFVAGCQRATTAPGDSPLDDTGMPMDRDGPTAQSTLPENGEQDVAINRTVRVSFDEALAGSTVNAQTITLETDGMVVGGAVVLTGATATLTPAAWLAPRAVYRATVTTGVEDLAGNRLEEALVFGFTTGDDADLAPPVVVSTSPGNFATDIAITRAVSAWFDERLDPATVGEGTFTVEAPAGGVAGTVMLDGNNLVFTPEAVLEDETLYEARIDAGVLDLAGNALPMPVIWRFTTGITPSAPGGIDLQSAADFAVLAGSGVGNTGATVITGNLGVSPGTALEGFPPGVVDGVVHADDALALEGQLDLALAIDDAASRSGAVALPADVGAQALGPGVYAATALAITGGDLTLDAQGDPSSVWIVQVGSDLVVAAGTHVKLAGGARSANVFWQVGGSATLGVDSALVGNLLVGDAITLRTGATLEGRALAGTGSVTLDTNAIALP